MNSKKVKIISACAVVVFIIIAFFAGKHQLEKKSEIDNPRKNIEDVDVADLPDGHVAGGVADVEWDEDEEINIGSTQNKSGSNASASSSTSSNNNEENAGALNGNSSNNNGENADTSNGNSSNNNGTNDGTSNDNSSNNNGTNDSSSNTSNGNSEEIPVGSLSYEEYMALDTEAQQEYFSSFSSPEAFFEWFNKAKKEYEAKDDSIEIDGNGSIDINDILNGKK